MKRNPNRKTELCKFCNKTHYSHSIDWDDVACKDKQIKILADAIKASVYEYEGKYLTMFCDDADITNEVGGAMRLIKELGL